MVMEESGCFKAKELVLFDPNRLVVGALPNILEGVELGVVVGPMLLVKFPVGLAPKERPLENVGVDVVPNVVEGCVPREKDGAVEKGVAELEGVDEPNTEDGCCKDCAGCWKEEPKEEAGVPNVFEEKRLGVETLLVKGFGEEPNIEDC